MRALWRAMGFAAEPGQQPRAAGMCTIYNMSVDGQSRSGQARMKPLPQPCGQEHKPATQARREGSLRRIIHGLTRALPFARDELRQRTYSARTAAAGLAALMRP